MDDLQVLSDVMATPFDAWPELPDRVLITAIEIAVEHDQTKAALTLGIEVGRREQERDLNGELIAAVADTLGA